MGFKRVNILSATICAIALSATINAQSLSNLEEKLSFFERNDNYQSVQYSNVVINKSESAREALEALIEQSKEPDTEEVKAISRQGYRIGIFFDNGATARAMAEEVMQRCDSLLGDIPATMSYDNPYFKVSAGYCINPEEAVMMLHRVQRIFPQAYLMRENITPNDLVKSREAELNLQLREEQAKMEATMENELDSILDEIAEEEVAEEIAEESSSSN